MKSYFYPIFILGFLITGCAAKEVKQTEPKVIQFKEKKTKAAEATSLPELTSNSDLKDYLRYAALNNGELKAAFNQWKAALQKIPQARSLPNPMLNFVYYIKEVETRVGPQEYALGGAQSFPWLMKLVLKGDVAAKNALAAQQKYEATKLKVFYEVKKTYFELYYLNRAIEITKENIQLLSYFEKVAQTKYRAAMGSHPDVIKVQVEQGKLEDRLKTLQDLKGPLLAQFNAALNRSVFQLIPWPKNIDEDFTVVNDQALLKELLKNSPRLKELRYEVEKQEKGIGLARQSFFPDVTVGADYIDTGSAIARTPDSGKDPVLFKVQASVPIWIEKNLAEVKEAKAKKEAAQTMLQDKEFELASEMKMVLYNFQDAKRKKALFKDSLIPKAEQSLKVTQKAFEAGSADLLTLIDAQRILLEFNLSYERALSNQAERFAELEMLVGEEIGREEGLK